MKMVIFTQNHAGYKAGAGQLFDETIAKALIDAGYAKELKQKQPDTSENLMGTPSDEERAEQEKAMETPKKDKMIHKPKHKK